MLYRFQSLFWRFDWQLSFASTATTIVSGAVAERVKLHSYMIFAMTNAIAYSIPAHWIWTSDGFLNKMGVVDIAGSGTIQLAISFKTKDIHHRAYMYCTYSTLFNVR